MYARVCRILSTFHIRGFNVFTFNIKFPFLLLKLIIFGMQTIWSGYNISCYMPFSFLRALCVCVFFFLFLLLLLNGRQIHTCNFHRNTHDPFNVILLGWNERSFLLIECKKRLSTLHSLYMALFMQLYAAPIHCSGLAILETTKANAIIE